MDESQELPPNSPLVNPYRLAKGDLDIHQNSKGIIDAAWQRRDALIDYLIALRILEDHHAYYAMVFYDLRRAFRRRVSYKSNSIYAAEFFGADTSDGHFETCYLRVCRQIAGKTETAIMFICDNPPTVTNKKAAYIGRFQAQAAFERLVSAIDDARKWADEQNENRAHPANSCLREPPDCAND